MVDFITSCRNLKV